MGSNSAASVNMLGWFSFMAMVVLLLMMVGSVRSSDMAKEREECTNQLISLATCLPYVGGTAKAPTSTCCTALKQVVVQSKKCLCILIRDRDDPSLALKINATLALGLPATCKASADVKKCPSILNLAPNSPQAKVFKDFDGLMGKDANNSTTPSSNGNSASSVTGGNGKTPNDGHSHNKGVIGAEVFSLWCLTLLLIMGVQ